MIWDYDTFPLSPGGRHLDPFSHEYVDDLYHRFGKAYYGEEDDVKKLLPELLMFLAHVTPPVTDRTTIQEWGRERRSPTPSSVSDEEFKTVTRRFRRLVVDDQ